MKRKKFHHLQLAATTILSVALFSCGCEQAGTVLDDVKSKVAGESEQPSVAETDSALPAPPAPTPKPAAPAPPSPEELVTTFLKLKSHEISDGSLATVTSLPEAAAKITTLEIQTNDGFSGNGIKHLTKMNNLSTLTLRTPRLSPEDLSALAGVSSLKQLSLNGTTSNDEVVGQLTSLSNLESLQLSGTRITPVSAASLGQMARLSSIDLSGTAADDAVVSAMASLPIREINLSKTRITNASLAVLSKMPALEALNVSFTGVTGDGFKGFGRTKIKTLSVGETRFELEGFRSIRGMSALEDLNIYNAGLVEHKSANVFRTFRNLRVLNAGKNSVTNAGMDVFFKGHKSLEELRLSHNKRISDQGLAALVGVKTLKLLVVDNTGCGAQGARALKEKLPDCKIQTSHGTF